jgi:hypothetical protein
MVTHLTQLTIDNPEDNTVIVAAIVAAMVQPAEFTTASGDSRLVHLFDVPTTDLSCPS